MEKVLLGKTGYKIAPVVFGGIINTDESQEDANRYVASAIERGVNYFDVAPTYGNAEERLGAALEPFRKDVYLACKTARRDAAGAKEDLLESMRRLRTDYFDVYQLHSIQLDSDVNAVFSKGGAMETLEWAKKEGIARKLGITAHSEEQALHCLDLYDFNSVLFTMYWVPAVLRGVGDKLAEAAKARNIGLLCMKVLAHRAWREGEIKPDDDRRWYKRAELGSPLALAAMKFCLSKGDALVPPGQYDAFCYMLDHIDEVIANPLSHNDLEFLKEEAEKIKEDELKLIGI